MGSPKVDIQQVLLRLDNLDGVSDQIYYGIPLSDGRTTLGLCAQGASKGGAAALYNEAGDLVEVDCRALAAKLDQLVKIAEKNPATPLFSLRPVLTGVNANDEEIKLFGIVDDWLKALLLGTKTPAKIPIDKFTLGAALATANFGWDNLR